MQLSVCFSSGVCQVKVSVERVSLYAKATCKAAPPFLSAYLAPYSARKHGGRHIGSVLCSIFRLSNSVRYHWHNTLAILVKMTSIICSVRGCHNNWNKRRVPLQQYYVVHGKTRAECCGATFNLHPPPSSDEDRRMWLKALHLKNPPKKPYSVLFIL